MNKIMNGNPDLIVKIAGRFPSLNDQVKADRTNYRVGAGMKKKHTGIAYVNAKLQSKGMRFERAFFLFDFFEPNKKRDPDNIAFAKKYILDGFVNAGIIQNDGWKQIAGFSSDFHIDKENPRVIVSIWSVI